MIRETIREESIFGDAVFSYSVKDGLKDGLFHDLTSHPEMGEVAKKHYDFPVIITNGLFLLIENAVKCSWAHCSYKGLINDILTLSKEARFDAFCKNRTTSNFWGNAMFAEDILFDAFIPGETIATKLWACIQAYDEQGSPCLTIFLPSER